MPWSNNLVRNSRPRRELEEWRIVHGVSTVISRHLQASWGSECFFSNRTTTPIDRSSSAVNESDATASLVHKCKIIGSTSVDNYVLHPELSSFNHNIRRPVINMKLSSSIIYFMIFFLFFFG